MEQKKTKLYLILDIWFLIFTYSWNISLALRIHNQENISYGVYNMFKMFFICDHFYQLEQRRSQRLGHLWLTTKKKLKLFGQTKAPPLRKFKATLCSLYYKWTSETYRKINLYFRLLHVFSLHYPAVHYNTKVIVTNFILTYGFWVQIYNYPSLTS